MGETKESFDAADFLAGLFNPAVIVAIAAAKPAPAAGGVDGKPESQIDLGQVIEPPACPRCGLLEMWQTAAGNWRCLRCDPPKVAIRLLERVQGIRQRLGMPARPETAVMLADLRRLTSQ